MYEKVKPCGCVEVYTVVASKPKHSSTILCKMHGALARGELKVIK